jgi:hypothetical protein
MTGVTEILLCLTMFLSMTLDTKLIGVSATVNYFTMLFYPFGPIAMLGTINGTVDNE